MPEAQKSTQLSRHSMQAHRGNVEPSPKSKDLVVFDILRASNCAACGKELLKGDLLFMERERPLCLGCADLDHLVYLSRGEAALTRRAKKHSILSAVVVRFSRARGRYERQGILVEEPALERAEEECLADAQQRAAKRERDEVRRTAADRDLNIQMADAILRLFPGCPPKEAQAIAVHTAVRGSGRVGRTSAGRGLAPEALTAAVIAAIRHTHTNYDRLLMAGHDRMDARNSVRDTIERVIEHWRSPVSP